MQTEKLDELTEGVLTLINDHKLDGMEASAVLVGCLGSLIAAAPEAFRYELLELSVRCIRELVEVDEEP